MVLVIPVVFSYLSCFQFYVGQMPDLKTLEAWQRLPADFADLVPQFSYEVQPGETQGVCRKTLGMLVIEKRTLNIW